LHWVLHSFSVLHPLGKMKIPYSLTVRLAKILATDPRRVIRPFDRWDLCFDVCGWRNGCTILMYFIMYMFEIVIECD